MKKDYKGKSKKGGVYQIKNLKNGKIYIGSAKCFQVRASQHQTQLKNQKHSNKHLQASWNKYGSKNFLFEVLEVVEGDKGERFRIEQKYIDKLIKEGKWEQTFNFKKKAVQKERSCFSKTPEETRNKLSKASKKNWQDPEYLAKNPCGTSEEKSERLKKLWKENRETLLKKIRTITPARRKQRENIGNLNIKTYEGFHNHKTGQTYKNINNLSDFCRKHELSVEYMYKVASGKINHYRGWTLIGKELEAKWLCTDIHRKRLKETNLGIKVEQYDRDLKVKICSKCKQEKSIENFYKNTGTKNFYRSWCKQCYSDSYYKKQPNIFEES